MRKTGKKGLLIFGSMLIFYSLVDVNFSPKYHFAREERANANVFAVQKGVKKKPLYEPNYDPTISYLPVELKALIETHAKDYYNPDWEISLSQYEAWICQIALVKGGKLGYSAQGGEAFYHERAGKDFPFHTEVGIFQLGIDEEWDRMSMLQKIDPEESLLSILRWHMKRFNNGSKLSDFRDAWQDIKETELEKYWLMTTGATWRKCKNKKMEVSFHPPITDDSPFEEVAKNLGCIRWNLDGTNLAYRKTWLIKAKAYYGPNNCCREWSYYYSKDDEWEIMVLNSPGLNKAYRRNFSETYLPSDINGFSCDWPIIDL